MMQQRVRVAAAQIDTAAGETAQNLAHMADMAEEAAAQGAQLLLFPELAPCGYALDTTIWEAAEVWGGSIMRSVCALAARLKMYIGTSFLEAEGEDFYNTWFLAAPTGEVAGRVRKTPPADGEAMFFRSGGGSHVVETQLGRIGVAICYEALLHARLSELYAAQVDLVLISVAASHIRDERPGDDAAFTKLADEIGAHWAATLGVPIVVANRCGPLSIPLGPDVAPIITRFCGRSAIVDGDGSHVAALVEEEGVIVGDVQLHGAGRSAAPPVAYGGMWAQPVPWFAEQWPIGQAEAEKWYAASDERRTSALRTTGAQAAAVPRV